jgi:DNA-binding GntR family transcriptional regulator
MNRRAMPPEGGGRRSRRPQSVGHSTAEIARALKDRILEQSVLPGSRLHEVQLSEEFGVSRARIREAIGGLEHSGLVRRVRNRGAMVVRLEREQVFHIYDVREILEGLSARLAAQRVPGEAWIDAIEYFDGPMAGFVARGELQDYVVGVEALRRRIAAAAANPVLTGMLESVQDQTHAIIHRIMLLPGRAAVGLQEHRETLQALRAQDPERAERAVRSNIRNARDCLKRYQQFVL